MSPGAGVARQTAPAPLHDRKVVAMMRSMLVVTGVLLELVARTVAGRPGR